MSLVKCRECKKEISSEAKICPHCGIEKPTKKGITFLQVFLLMIFTIIALVIFDSDSKKKVDTDKLVKSEDALFSEKELKLFTILMRDDINSIFKGGTPLYLTKTNYIVVSSDSIQKDYEKNEINADEKYKNKDLIVNAKIKSIDKDVYNNAYLSLYGGTNQFLNPQAKFKDGYISWLSNLNKNQNITIVCESSKMFGGSVYLDDCIPSSNWIENKTIELINNTHKLLKNDNLELQVTIKFIKMITPKLLDSSGCFNDNSDSCIKELKKIMPTVKKEMEEIKGK
ncbi:OB-fold putative lipoprotein [bacterium]|nr:OB-fold putative lipoprotein [bacterium]